MKRLLYLDVLRGFFIIYIIIVHALNAVVFNNDAGALESIKPWVFLLLSPLAIVATWAPIFVLISGTAHAYSMYGQMARYTAVPGAKSPLWAIWRGSLTNSAVLYLYSLLNMTLFHHAMEFNGRFQHTMVTSSIKDGVFHLPSPELLFYNDALSIIAISGFVTTTVLCLLWCKGGFEKTGRNFGFLFGLMVVFMFGAPYLHATLDAPYYQAITEHHSFRAFLLKFVIGANQSPFPNVGYGFLGCILAVSIARQTDAATMRRFGYGLSACFLLLAGLKLAFEGFAPIELTYHTLPMKLHLLNVGLMLGLSTFLIGRMEYASTERRAVIAQWTMILRRFSMAALTVFLTEGVVSVLAGKAFLFLWQGGGAFPKNPLVIIAFLALLIGIWSRVLRLWERYDFKFGFEWWLIFLVGKIRGRRSARLQVKEVLYQPTNTVPGPAVS